MPRPFAHTCRPSRSGARSTRPATGRLADDLEARLELEVLPALARARDDLMVAERQRSQRVQQQQLQAELPRLPAQ